jgi:hypothetical protein
VLYWGSALSNDHDLDVYYQYHQHYYNHDDHYDNDHYNHGQPDELLPVAVVHQRVLHPRVAQVGAMEQHLQRTEPELRKRAGRLRDGLLHGQHQLPGGAGQRPAM